MQGTVEVVSPSGKGFRIVGQEKGAWYNKGKMLAESAIANLKKGDVVDFNAPDGKWVVSVRKLDGGDSGQVSVAPSEEVQKVFGTGATSSAQVSAKKSDAQARGCAANAVLGSPYVSTLVAGECPEETVQNLKNFMEKVAEFVYGGKW